MPRKPPGKQRVREAAASYGHIEVPASDLKNDWHHWLDIVARGRRTLVVTRYGTPIATLGPIDEAREPEAVFGSLRGWVKGETNLIGPTSDEWDAES